MWQITVRWSNPYTQPPEGRPLVKKEFLEKTSHRFDWENKDEIDKLSDEYGYCVGLTKIRENEIKRKVFSEEAKLNLRKKHCVRRARKKYPLFIEYLEKDFKAHGWELEQKYIDLFYNPLAGKKSKLQQEKAKLKKQPKKFISKKKAQIDLTDFGHLTLLDAYKYKKEHG